jgi:3-hydroxyisobutyrate dehydrogenase-like beta-hydroxyacid dehydrogenase
MQGGAADSFVLRHDVASIFAGHYDPSFPIALCLKDLGLIQELMTETGVRDDLTHATHERFKEARDRYGEAAGEMTLCKTIEDAAGVSLRVEGDWVPPWEVKRPEDR